MSCFRKFIILFFFFANEFQAIDNWNTTCVLGIFSPGGKNFNCAGSQYSLLLVKFNKSFRKFLVLWRYDWQGISGSRLGSGLLGFRPVSLSLSFSISTSFCFLSQDLEYFFWVREHTWKVGTSIQGYCLDAAFSKCYYTNFNKEMLYSIQSPHKLRLEHFPFLPLSVFSLALPVIGIIVVLVFLSVINLKCYFPALTNKFVPISTHLMAF